MAHAAMAFVQCWQEVTLVDSTGCLRWRWVIQIVQGLHDQLSVDLGDHWLSDASDFFRQQCEAEQCLHFDLE